MGNRTFWSVVWASGSYVGGKVLVLLSVAILARLLSPAEFGLVGLALTVTVFLDVVADLGVAQALVVAPEDELEERAHTAFTVSSGLGLLLTLLTAAFAPLAADFFREPEVTALLAVLGATFFLRALGLTHFALAQKRLDFKARTYAELIAIVVRGVIGVGLALAGAGAWSLVAAYVVGAAAMTVALWVFVPFRPRVRVRRDHARALLSFGGGLTLLAFLSAFITNFDYVAIGRVLGETELGLYTLGFRLPELLVMNLSFAAGAVLFPAFTSVDRAGLGTAFLSTLRFTTLICLPIAVGLVILAEPLIRVAFGDQWDGSAPVMRVLALFALSAALDIPAGSAYKALGRIDILLKLAVPRTVIVVVGVVLLVERGIVPVAAWTAGTAAVFCAIQLAIAPRMLGAPASGLWTSTWPSVAGAILLAGVLAAVDALVGPPLLTLVVALPLGAVTYLASQWLLAPEPLRRLYATAFPGRVSASERTP